MSGSRLQDVGRCKTRLRSRREFLKASASIAAFLSAEPNLSFLHALDSSSDDALRARLAADPLRPQFHLLPAKNWMNDPNGPIYWKGHYHMFFQYDPNAAAWGDMHWAHAVSDDMIHWRHLPMALAPTPGWDDADGCFTGSAVDDRGTATILYTGVKTTSPDRATLRDGVHNFREVLCLATSRDPQLRTWNKWKDPVLQPPADPRLTGFRDPFLWRGSNVAEMRRSSAAPLQDRGSARDHGDTWYLGVGSGVRKEGGQVLLYRSKDLHAWEYLHPLASGKWTGRESVNPVDSGEMWECPDFFPLGSKHVLLYSTAGKVIWETGQLDPKELVFHSENRGTLDHGAYYAQKTQLDAHGNRILWGWITEERTDEELKAAGWAGCMSLPRILSIGSDGGLEMRFTHEMQSLRSRPFALYVMDWNPRLAKPAAVDKLQIANLAAEFVWSMPASWSQSKWPQLSQPPRVEFTLADSAGPWFSLTLDAPPEGGAKLTTNGKVIELPAGIPTEREFHLFIDGSVAELICDNRYAITTRVYRKPDGPLRLSANFDSLRSWHMLPISSHRLTS